MRTASTGPGRATPLRVAAKPQGLAEVPANPAKSRKTRAVRRACGDRHPVLVAAFPSGATPPGERMRAVVSGYASECETSFSDASASRADRGDRETGVQRDPPGA